MKKIILLIIIAVFFFLPKQAYAFTSAADTITTSRPSAATPLGGTLAAGDTWVALPAGATNLSTFLASDAAKFWKGAQEILTVASASADRKILWFASPATQTHTFAIDTIVTSAVTAKHIITFKLSQQASVGDILKVTFPGAADNSASPSATTFAFNNLQTTNVTVSATSGQCTSIAVAAPSVQCTVPAAQAITAGSTVTITIGSTTPALINPTKTQAIGTSDLWKITLNHTAGGVDVEAPAKIAIASIESVYVSGIVDASITMVITGLANGIVINANNAACAAGFNMTTNSGAASSPTSVNLGTISTGKSYAGQKISISTNAPSGYALTATASGRLTNPASGYWFTNAQGGLNLTANNTPAPAALAGGVNAFGISACGTHANTALFGTVTADFGNPSNSAGNDFNYKLASTTGATASVDTSIVYGVSAAATTPAGTYSTILSYVATATF